MPLLRTTLSSIGSVYLSSDGTDSGYAARVDWPDFWRMKKVDTVSYAYDMTPSVSRVGVGAKGPITLVIPSCPSEVYDGLRTIQTSGAHVTATLHHPQLGEKQYEVRVVSLVPSEDDQDEEGDPLKGVTVRLVSFGLAS